MDERIGAPKNPREPGMVGRRHKAAHDVARRIDTLRKGAEQPDLRMGLHEGELLAEAIGPGAVVGIEPRQVGRARRGDRIVERRHDALRRLMEEADAAVIGGETGEHGRGAVI